MDRSLIWPALLVIVMLLAAAAVSPPADAQQAFKIATIGLLFQGTPGSAAHLADGFRQGLRELGQVEGKTFVLERRYAAGTSERVQALAREPVGLEPDVIVTFTDPAIAAVRRETRTIPIGMAFSVDPVGPGFAASLPRPGGDVTGLCSVSAELGGERRALLEETEAAVT